MFYAIKQNNKIILCEEPKGMIGFVRVLRTYDMENNTSVDEKYESYISKDYIVDTKNLITQNEDVNEIVGFIALETIVGKDDENAEDSE